MLIYAGHNEYLGVIGVGSAYAAKGGWAITLLYLQLKELRLFQLLDRLYVAFRPQPTGSGASERTLMARLAREQDIAYESDGIIGAKHMLEHLHPTPRGYFFLAEAFADAIDKAGLIPGEKTDFPRESAWREIPLTDTARILARYKITRLKSNYPFTAAPIEPPAVPARLRTDHFALYGKSGCPRLST